MPCGARDARVEKRVKREKQSRQGGKAMAAEPREDTRSQGLTPEDDRANLAELVGTEVVPSRRKGRGGLEKG
jgi:hypothetical protein